MPRKRCILPIACSSKRVAAMTRGNQLIVIGMVVVLAINTSPTSAAHYEAARRNRIDVHAVAIEDTALQGLPE